MELTKKTILALPGLCENSRTLIETLALPEVFTAREAVAAYLAAGGTVPHIVHIYGALVATGLAEDTGAIWKIARLAFAVQREDSRLRPWAEKLGPENWVEANTAAVRAADSDARYARARALYHYPRARAAEARADKAASAARAAAEAAKMPAAHEAAAHEARAYAYAAARATEAYGEAAHLAEMADSSCAYAAALASSVAVNALAAAAAAAGEQQARVLEIIFAALGEC